MNNLKRFISDELSRRDLNNQTKLLFCLKALNSESSTAKIRNFAIEMGLRSAAKWNCSTLLGNLEKRSLISKHDKVWQIRSDGEEELSKCIKISKLDIAGMSKAVNAAVLSVENQMSKVSDAKHNSFLNEVVVALNAEAFRAATIMMWIGSLHHLQDYTINNFSKEVRTASVARLSTVKKQHKGITKLSDFEEINENVQLQIFHDAGVIGKTLKNQLIERLNLRNACGHPNSVSITEGVASMHVEFLAANIFSL